MGDWGAGILGTFYIIIKQNTSFVFSVVRKLRLGDNRASTNCAGRKKNKIKSCFWCCKKTKRLEGVNEKTECLTFPTTHFCFVCNILSRTTQRERDTENTEGQKETLSQQNETSLAFTLVSTLNITNSSENNCGRNVKVATQPKNEHN